MIWQIAVFAAIGVFCYLWSVATVVSYFTPQLVAGFTLGYFLTVGKNKKLAAYFLTATVLLLVFSTGGANSPLFFLIYFLLFGLAFLFSPYLSTAFSIILILLLFTEGVNPTNLLNVLSLLIIAPLAWFFGQQVVLNQFYRRKLKKTEAVVSDEEREVLLWLTLHLRPMLTDILEATANLLADLAHLTPEQKRLLKLIRRRAKKLLKTGKILEKFVDARSEE